MHKGPRYTEIEGLRLNQSFVPEIYRDAMNFKSGKDDVFVVTYPKCGTTWMTQIVALILRKGKPFTSKEDYFSFIPFLETTPMNQIVTMDKPRLFKTHLPLHQMNFSKKSKYIYVARHPSDCIVSFYHHCRFFPTYFFTDGTLEEFFEVFIKGEVDYGDYFDHLLAWYRLRNKSNVLFLSYESMKSDPRGTCLKVAGFLGKDFYKILLDKDEAILKKVLKCSSLDYMKSTINDFWNQQFISFLSTDMQKASLSLKKVTEVFKEAVLNGERSQGSFIREGRVGEGKVKLSKEQQERLKIYIHQKTTNSDIMNLWENID
ncbi:sulfotransferase 1C3 [Caerostris darwini]|uniref:Sulfotransferase 1C3 n=1 Tax=Caerostris darwini TaxID=1538125 RepID=A0AAV4VK46_9ARAC|nr:sulfotransferase 1C3 [Caerostris darwini]